MALFTVVHLERSPRARKEDGELESEVDYVVYSICKI